MSPRAHEAGGAEAAARRSGDASRAGGPARLRGGRWGMLGAGTKQVYVSSWTSFWFELFGFEGKVEGERWIAYPSCKPDLDGA